ncbi:helix-turn-helix domain-containing protein [Alkalihalobacillus sp. NPDC078783]
MISYEPLFKTLYRKDLLIKDLYEVIGSDTATKLRKGNSMRLETIERLCKHLQVPIEDVVKIDFKE